MNDFHLTSVINEALAKNLTIMQIIGNSSVFALIRSIPDSLPI